MLQKTEGYSGSDIRLVAKEAAMRPVRKVFEVLERHTEGKLSTPRIGWLWHSTYITSYILRWTKPNLLTVVVTAMQGKHIYFIDHII